MKIKFPFLWFILAALAMVLATKSAWAILGTWALTRFVYKVADRLSTATTLHEATGRYTI